MWFDSHCHLHLCEEGAPVAGVIERARAAGVSGMLAVGIEAASSRRSLELAKAHGLVSSAGVHPDSAGEFDDRAAAEIERMLSEGEVVGVGETGLDYYRNDTSPEAQAVAFGVHIELAKVHDKALVIHTRASASAAMDQLEAAGPPRRFVFHCWSGDEEELARALEMGSYISFAGNVSFKSASDLRAAAAKVPEDRLLIETDSPFLAPVPQRGRSNEPSFVVHVGAAVAEARGASVEELARLTSSNAHAFLGLG